MKKHHCPICLRPSPIQGFCPKHGNWYYSVEKRTAKTKPGTYTRKEVAKMLRETRRQMGPRKPRRVGPN